MELLPKKRINGLHLQISFIYFIVITALCFLYIRQVHQNDQILANHLSEMMRRDFINGNKRAAYSKVSTLINSDAQFYRIIYNNEEGETILEQGDDLCSFCFDVAIESRLFFDLAKQNILGTLVFNRDYSSNIFQFYLIAVLGYLLCLPIIIFFVTKFRRYQQLNVEWETQKIRDHTSKILAHDLRKPFHNIKMYINAMEDAKGQEQEYQIRDLAFGSMHQEIQKADSIIRNIVTKNNHVNKGNATNEFYLNEIIDEIQSSFEKDRVDLSVKNKMNLKLTGDREGIKSVIKNIVSNGIEASRGTGKYWIDLKLTKPWWFSKKKAVAITIGNTGSHLSKKEAKLVFTPSFSKGKKSGLGFGLTLAKEIIKSHKGKILCRPRSNRVEFKIFLPVS